MSEISALVLYNIRRKFLPLAYFLWFIAGMAGFHRLYIKGPAAFWPQFLFGLITLIATIFSDWSYNMTLITFFLWVVFCIWLAIDFYLIYRWIKIYNLSLYHELFVSKP